MISALIKANPEIAPLMQDSRNFFVSIVGDGVHVRSTPSLSGNILGTVFGSRGDLAVLQFDSRTVADGHTWWFATTITNVSFRGWLSERYTDFRS